MSLLRNTQMYQTAYDGADTFPYKDIVQILLYESEPRKINGALCF